MKKQNVNIIIVFILGAAMLSSCNHHKNSILKNDSTIRIDIDSLLPLTIDSLYFVPLETIDDALITESPNIKYFNGKFYICNADVSEKIFVFDKKGKFVSMISHYGQGPYEYLSISDYIINKQGIFIYDAVKKQIINYDFNGTFIDKKTIKTDFSNFIEYNGNYILYDGHHPVFYLCDKKGIIKDSCIISDGEIKYTTLPPKRPMGIIDSEIWITTSLCYEIYGYKNNTFDKIGSFDFGKNNMPEDYKKLKGSDFNLSKDLMSEQNKNKVLWIDYLTQCNKWILCNLETGYSSYHVVFTDKSNNNRYSLEMSNELFEYIDKPITSDGEFFIAMIQSRNIQFIKNLAKKNINEISPYIRQLINLQINEEDNPVLCFFKLNRISRNSS